MNSQVSGQCLYTDRQRVRR